VAAANWHARRQVAFGDAGEPGLELRERPPHASAHEVDCGNHAYCAEGEPEDRVAQHLARRQLERLLSLQQGATRLLTRHDRSLVGYLCEAVERADPPGVP